MRVGLDGTPVWGSPVGQYTYMANLIKNIVLLGSNHDFTIYCRKVVPDEFRCILDRVTFKICKFKNRKMCEQISLPCFAYRDHVDLIHTCWIHPLIYRGKSVVTIHGLEWRTHPDVPIHSRISTLYYKTTIENTSRKATRLIAISKFIKQAFIDELHVPEEKIDVVYHGVNLSIYNRITDEEQLKKVKNKYNLPDRFILFVGAMVANKNLVRLIKAFQAIRNEPDNKDVGLVIAGIQTWNSKPIIELAKKLEIERHVTFAGFVPIEDMASLYTLSTLYAFPSIVEGFGLPILEAFACETAVITSNATAMPEVAGDAAILIDPYNVDDIADAMVKVLSDESLQKVMIKKGLERAKNFTWKKTAEKTLEVYKKASAS